MPSGAPEGPGRDGWKAWATEVTFDVLLALGMLSKTNARWLRAKKRKKWWKRGDFPLVPKDSLAAEKRKAGEMELEVLWKVVPLGILFFCASFNLTLLQNMRDALIVTSGGAEQLPFLAAYCVLPCSIAFFVYYNRLRDSVRPERVFYAAIAPLLTAYVLFATVLYPAADALHFNHLSDVMRAALPAGLHGLVGVVTNWTYSLFFCLAELWGTVVISLLFWGIANEVCTVSEAKSVYPLLGIAANLALVFGGHYVKMINATVATSTLVSFRYLIGSILAVSGVMCATKNFIDRRAAAAAGGAAPAEAGAPGGAKPKKRKATWGDTWDTLSQSRKIRNLALLVVGYALSHRLFEVAWKGQLKVLYPSAQAYQSALADVSIYTGFLTIGMMMAGRFVFQLLGWGVAAFATPIVMLVAGAGFFGLTMYTVGGGLDPVQAAALGTVGCLAGSVTQVFARSSKFSLFDPAKEMVYIEMDPDEKAKGKAAVDLVGSQMGKSGASWITQAVLLAFGSITAATPFIGGAFVLIIGVWLNAVRQLNKDLIEQEAALKAEAEAAAAAAAAEAAALPAGGKQVELPNLRARTLAANALGNGNSTLRGAAEGQGFASN